MHPFRQDIDQITAIAPATISNCVVGFDCLGLACEAPFDKVTLHKRQDSKLVITEIKNADNRVEEPISEAPLSHHRTCDVAYGGFALLTLFS